MRSQRYGHETLHEKVKMPPFPCRPAIAGADETSTRVPAMRLHPSCCSRCKKGRLNNKGGEAPKGAVVHLPASNRMRTRPQRRTLAFRRFIVALASKPKVGWLRS